jgi:hypothetical protein
MRWSLALLGAVAIVAAVAIGLGARHLTTETAATPTAPPVARAATLHLSRVSLPAGLNVLTIPAYPRHRATSKAKTSPAGATSGTSAQTGPTTATGSGAQAASTPASSTPKTSSSTTAKTKTKTTAKRPSSSETVGGGDTLGGG